MHISQAIVFLRPLVDGAGIVCDDWLITKSFIGTFVDFIDSLFWCKGDVESDRWDDAVGCCCPNEHNEPVVVADDDDVDVDDDDEEESSALVDENDWFWMGCDLA